MPGLLRGMARTAVIAGTATSVSNRVSRRQARRWGQQEYEQEQQYAAPPAPAAAPAAQVEDPIQRLSELGDLHSKGVLTDDEFAAAKRQILNG